MATAGTYYPHHQTYQPGLGGYALNGALSNGYGRVANSHSTAYPAVRNDSNDTRAQNSSTRPPVDGGSLVDNSAMSPATQTSSRNKRQPDWNEFYKNGLPKEVIVIDDDSPGPSDAASRAENAGGDEGVNGGAKHADKKRKTAASAIYDPVYQQQTSYSTTQTPYGDHSSHNTVSTDRTTSAITTTAPTSLGSQASTGPYHGQLEENTGSLKRKRSTRQAAQDEALREVKKRHLERPEDPYDSYVPPPNPPIKAKDVYVQVVHDHKRNHHEPKCDDEDGHYIVTPDADLTERYQIVKLLGQGTFGKVVEAYDRRKKTRCAVKVIRSVQKYRDASRIELRVLSTLSSNDKHNRNRCIHLRDCFDYKSHICIVTDLYGQSVFDFLKANAFTPFPSTHIQEFARQLFTSVAFLHDLNLIHTDLKPENILLVRNEYQTFTYNRHIPSSSRTTSRSARHRKVLLDPEIRLIDFGSATFNDEYHSSVVSTRHYRAPEIILNLGWSFPCDIWSIGCILVEFFTGDALFQTHDNLEHLAMMEAVCNGKLDRDMLRQVMRGDKGHSRNSAAQYFKNSKLDYPNNETPRASKKYVKAMKKLQEVIPPHTEFNMQFLDLLRRIFVYNPSKRITAHEALKHQWFREPLADDGTEAKRIKMEKLAARAREKAAAGSAPKTNGFH